MDFLDPRKRRAHRNRLIFGYILVSIAILLGAVILVYSANGYGINTKTGDIVQNGLLFVDSKPGGADVYLNGQNHGSKTAARLILPAGNYAISLKKTGYRDWSRSFSLTEHAISRYIYPFLFPVKPSQQTLKNYPSLPPLVLSSPDHRWLLLQTSATSPSFDEFDTSATDLKQSAKTLNLPDGLFSSPLNASSQLKAVEWSTDNKNVLLEHDFGSSKEFIIFNRASPADSFNINKTFSTNPTQVALRNKKIDQLYLYDNAAAKLEVGNVAKAEITPVLDHVLAFKPNGSGLIIYVTDQNAATGQVWARIWDSGKTYALYTFAAGDHYLIDMAQFQSNWYYIAGSDKAERINIYKNPLDGLKNTAFGKALPLISLRAPGADKLTFSDNTRFVEVQSGQSLTLYDFESQTRYHYTLQKPLSVDLQWMDGHRLIGGTAGQIFVTDYDSTNQQVLTPTLQPEELFFDADYNHLFSLSPADSGVNLVSVDLRAGADLPKP